MTKCRNHPHVDAAGHCAVCTIDFCGHCLVAVRATRYCAACKMRAIQGGAAAELGAEPCAEARQALVQGIIGMFCLGFVLGPMAIKNGLEAFTQFKADPRLTGWGKAVAGILLGVLDLVGWALMLVQRAT